MVKTTHPRLSTYSKQALSPTSIQSDDITPRVTASLSSLSDHDLLMLCTHYGTQAKVWKQKFLGLLPEVDKRKLYLKEGFTSVFEFAAKVGGVSKEQVLLVLRLEKKFQIIPQIHQALTSGQVPVHQLARVASVATPENQTFWLSQTKMLSKGALETLVKDTKSQTQPVPRHASKPNKTEKVEQFTDLGLSPLVHKNLLELRNKGIDLNQLLEEFLHQREEKIHEQKHKIAEELMETGKRTSPKENQLKAEQSGMRLKTFSSRYIPTKIKYLLKEEYGEKCAHQNCINKALHTHHTRRFGLSPNHNPLYLAPLCKYHHEIAHSIDVRVQGHKR